MSDKNKTGDKLVFGASPRADLLPPELKAESKMRGQRRALIGVAILAVLLVGVGYAYALIAATTASIRLASANAQTENLRNQQLEFVEVRELKDQLAEIETSQLIGVSTEIDWQEYIGLVQASLPAGTSIDQLTAATALPGSAETAGGSPLQAAQVASINFTATTTTLPSVSTWIDSLGLLPGFADATATSIKLDPLTGIYTVEMSMHVNYEALANRFGIPDEETEGAAEDGTALDVVDEDAAVDAATEETEDSE